MAGDANKRVDLRRQIGYFLFFSFLSWLLDLFLFQKEQEVDFGVPFPHQSSWRQGW
jgi:hypothetical protein